MFDFFKNLFYQISNYNCRGGNADKSELEELQRLMQDRINYLNNFNLDTQKDPLLLQYYDLYDQIQNCIFEDHSTQYILIPVILGVIATVVILRLWMIRKGKNYS